ncbi:MAG: hypothetical protein GTO14_07160 [Anaerolineales bacterium]|nr:hypothetical protein [Anaerolineales bacterium]
MAAVNPARLNTQVGELLACLHDPVALRRECLEILDFYADRTRRPSVSSSADDAVRIFRVPRPVIRALGTGLKTRVIERPDLAYAAASALWEAGYRETRQLACVILGAYRQSEIADWVTDWVPSCEDRVALAELARVGLQGWRANDVAMFLSKVAEWLESSSLRMRVFSLQALDAAAHDEDFDELPTVFRLITGRVATSQGREKRSLYSLVNTLATRSPPETARFLIDEINREGGAARKMTRSLIENFPSRQRILLERTLSP